MFVAAHPVEVALLAFAVVLRGVRRRRRIEDGVEQSGEAVVEVVPAQGHEAARAFGAGACDAAVAQELEVVTERGVSDRHVELPPGVLATVGERGNDVHPDRVAER